MYQLVARGHDRDHRFAVDRHLADIHRGQQGNIGRAQQARGGQRLTLVEITAGGTNVCFAVDFVAQRDQITATGHILLDHHKISALGHRCACENAHGLTGAKGAGIAVTGSGFADNLEHRVWLNLGAAQGIAIHRGGGKGRLGTRGCHILCHHAAMGGAQGDFLNRHDRGEREEVFQRLGDRDHGRV